ncbi:F-box protein At5g03970 [Juglans microcarpa x Juglans regia]|uniref:F-box protein At5g03970 n=1 Tax=Juglans microcarpa x Juglans regia TaxID=2249226 RepID=UPI001B7DE034|nr:F-box protein At5g03970 [Juglans microcarpa x Juglans regia]
MKSGRINHDNVHTALTCDDVLCEILLRLPEKSVFRLILVSRKWLHVICSNSFRSSYHSKWRESFHLLGFFVCNFLYLGRPRDGFRRPPWEPALPLLSTCKEGDDLKFSGVLKQLGYFIDSSNGFLLCGRHPMTYYIWSPITRKQYQLPQPQQYYRSLCMAFIVEDSHDDVICYKVIRAKCVCKPVEVNTVSIETFSSKTGAWKQSTLTCSSSFALCPRSVATVIGGVVYWFSVHKHLAIYDPYLGVRRLSLIKLPAGELSFDYEESVLGESSDGLLQYGQSSKLGIEIWVLEKEQSGYSSMYKSDTHWEKRWNLRYTLNFREMWKKNPTFTDRFSESQILSFLPRNSESVFIRSGSNIFLYQLESKRLDVVRYHGRGSSISWDSSKVVPYFRPSWPRSSLCQCINSMT